MAQPSIRTQYSDFVDTVQKMSDLVSRSATFLEIRDGDPRSLIAYDRYFIAEISFLRMALAWENFLGETFVRMLCGAQRFNVPQPVRLTQFLTIGNAKQVLENRRRYMNWINPNEVRESAKLFFRNGEPFESNIRAAFGELESIRIVRNKIAHSSDMAATKFTDLVRTQYGWSPRGMSPGRYLLDSSPYSNTRSHFDFYSATLQTVAKLITGA